MSATCPSMHSVTRELNLWTQEALASGVPFDIALLGRAVRRRNVAMKWGREATSLEWRRMIEDALADPEGTRSRWRLLLGSARPAPVARRS